MKKAKLLTMSLITLISLGGLISCGDKSPVEEGSSLINSTNSSTQDTTSEVLGEQVKEFVVNSSNVFDVINVNLYGFGIKENYSHPENFIISAKDGFIHSVAIKQVKRIQLVAYMSSSINPQEYLKIYNGNNETGKLVNGKNDLGAEDNQCVLTYEFDSPTDEFFILNDSASEVSVYSLKVEYIGEMGQVPEKEFIDDTKVISILEAISKGKELDYKQGTSEEYFIIEGKVSSIEEKQFSISDGTNTIIVYVGSKIEDIHMENSVKIKSRISNFYGTIELVNIQILKNEQATYTINLSENCSDNGKVELSKTTCSYNDNVQVTITPDEGYKLYSYAVDGIPQDLPSELTFNLTIEKSILIDVKFALESAKNIVELRKVTFEESEGFVHNASYNNQDPRDVGTEGTSWSIVQGNVTSTSAITTEGTEDKLSLQMRTYANTVVPYAVMNYDVNNVTEFLFDAKYKSRAYDLKVYVSNDSGANYRLINKISLSTTVNQYRVELSEEGENIRIKFEIEAPAGGTYAKDGQFTIDNIIFRGFAD